MIQSSKKMGFGGISLSKNVDLMGSNLIGFNRMKWDLNGKPYLNMVILLIFKWIFDCKIDWERWNKWMKYGLHMYKYACLEMRYARCSIHGAPFVS